MAEEILEITHESVVPAVAPRVEHAHLHVLLPGQRVELLIAADGLAVIDEDAHAYPARRRLAQRFGDQLSRLIAVKDVVLQVD